MGPFISALWETKSSGYVLLSSFTGMISVKIKSSCGFGDEKAEREVWMSAKNEVVRVLGDTYCSIYAMLEGRGFC